jgi:hypothetical protein
MLAFLAASSVTAETLNELGESYSEQLKKQSEISSGNARWQGEKSEKEEKLRELYIQRTWLENRIYQYKKYIVTINSNISELNRKKEELTRIAEELEPYLDETLKRLEDFIASDMPFLRRERSERLDFLRGSLADYRISAGEKLRRILEALKVEADYVKGIEVTTEAINVNGEELTAGLYRFGRLGYYYMTPDNKNFGYYSLQDMKWVQLDGKYKNEIIKAAEIAERKRMMEVIYLPVSAREAVND